MDSFEYLEEFYDLEALKTIYAEIDEKIIDQDQYYFSTSELPETYKLLQKLDDKLNTIRVDVVNTEGVTFFESEVSSVYHVATGDIFLNSDVNLLQGDVVVNDEGELTFTAEQPVYLVSAFYETAQVEHVLHVLPEISKYLDNQDLKALRNTSKSFRTAYIPKTEKILRECGVYNKGVGYWSTFIKKGSRFPECYQYFLDKRVNVNVNNGEALRIASQRGYTEVVKLLLDAGADVYVYEDKPLRFASEKGHTEIVKLLLEAGADVHAYGNEPLRTASQNGHTEIVKLLLNAGANVHANNGEALRTASQNGHTEIVKLLLDAGAYIMLNAGDGGPSDNILLY